MDKELITMTQKEARRYDVIKDLIKKRINGADTAKLLRLSVRQIQRIKVKVGPELKISGVIHGNRGKASNRQIDEETIKKAREHLNETYHDFNPLLAQ